MMNAMAQAAYESHVGAPIVFDDEQRLLDELLLEIFAPPMGLPGAFETSNNPVYASPASTKSGYEGSMNGSSQSSPMYPPNNNNSFWGTSPVKALREYRDQQAILSESSAAPGSPTGSSGDDSSMYMESGSCDDPTMSAKKKRQLEMRRKRNRESMRRVRQRKRLHYSELKTLLPGLEKRLTQLQEMKARQQEPQLASDSAASAIVQTVPSPPGPDLATAMDQLRITEEAARRENAWLEQEIDKYEQAFVAFQDEIDELRAADALTEAPLEHDPFAWTSRVVPLLPQFYQAEMVEFVRHSLVEVVRHVEAAHKLPETATGILGWRTWRTVDGPWIRFAVSKDFMHEDVEVVARKTWFVNSQSHTIHATMPRNHYMKVLRVVNENTIICARNLFFPGDETNYCNIYLLMNIKTPRGNVVAQRSLLPEDCDVLKRRLGPKFSYVNIFYAMILERLTTVDEQGALGFAPTGFKATFGGMAGNGTEIYANTWAKDLFIAMLRWESACVGPLYRLL